MSKNILYENVDMLDVMESCEDNSKDFIMLFMPTDGRKNQSSYYTDKGYCSCEVVRMLTANGPFIYADNEGHRGWTDYDDAIFYNAEQYGNYIDTISKVIQNAGRILRPQGTFCFGVPTHFMLVDNGETKDIPNISLMLQQWFSDIRKLEVPHFSVLSSKLAALRTMGFTAGTPYTLYICGSKVKNWSEKEGDSIYSLQRVQTPTATDFINKYEETIRYSKFPIGKTEMYGYVFGDEQMSELNRILISELYDDSLAQALLSKNAQINYPSLDYALDENGEIVATDSIGEQIEALEKQLTNFQSEFDSVRQNTGASFYSLLSKCLIKTFCEKGNEALFPYDRNGQYAWAANLYGMQWTALHVISRSKESIKQEHECFVECAYENEIPSKENLQYFHDNVEIPEYKYADYFARIKKEDYELRTDIPSHPARTYDANFLSSAAELNEMKAQFAKYSSLIGQVVECASTSGEESYGDVEQAVHAIISLAVRAREKTGIIDGDEAEKWYGDGWEKLSEQCRNYLQTAAAYEKLSEQSGNADCAPISIEYCRAVELETNRAIIKPYMQQFRDNKLNKDDFDTNSAAEYFKSVIERFTDDTKLNAIMLGEIGTSLSKAARSYQDKDIYYTLKEYCIKGGRKHLLDSDNVGKYILISKLRNKSAHPSTLNKGCLGQVRSLVKQGLKAQQRVKDNRPIKREPLSCIVISSGKGNKIDLQSRKLRQAIYDQIEMMDQSGIRNFVLTGKYGFNQMVSEEIQRYMEVKETEAKKQEAEDRKKYGNKYRPRKIEKIVVSTIKSKDNDAEEKARRQKEAIAKAQFCIAYYADDDAAQGNASEAKAMIDEAVKNHGLIVWNAYGIE